MTTLRASLRRAPEWVWVLAVFALSRVFTTVLTLAVARTQAASVWAPASPGYGAFTTIWDSGWYREIYEHGYPAVLPRSEDGTVGQNAWAFYPLYPALIRVLHGLTGLGWERLAPATSLLCAAGAVLVVHRLLRRWTGPGAALAAVTAVCFLPPSAVLQYGYAESLSLLLLALALLLVVRRSYATAVPVILAMCLTRPTGVPFGLMLAALFAVRWARHRTDPFPPRQVVGLLAAGAASVVGALAVWAAAWAVTGDLHAYPETEAAWRGGAIVPVQPWLELGRWLVGPAGGVVAFAVALAAVVTFFWSRPMRTIGPGAVTGARGAVAADAVLPLWCTAYVVYIVVFFFPQTSTWRILLPLFPVALGWARVCRPWWARVLVVVALAALQVWWVAVLWRFTPPADFPP